MNQRILLFVSILILAGLIIAGPAAAKVEKKQLGPYQIRFNLTRDVNVTVLPPHNDTYGVHLGEEVSILIIYSNAILLYKDPTIMKQSEERFMRGNCLLTQSYSRTIDGLDGVIVTGRKCYGNLTIFSATYCLDWHTVVSITSSWPWDEGTSELVDTIHIEEVGAT